MGYISPQASAVWSDLVMGRLYPRVATLVDDIVLTCKYIPDMILDFGCDLS